MFVYIAPQRLSKLVPSKANITQSNCHAQLRRALFVKRQLVRIGTESNNSTLLGRMCGQNQGLQSRTPLRGQASVQE